MSLERESIYRPGATFFERDGEVMFQFQADSSSKIGPRKATKADKAEHKGAYDAFNQGRLPQLDHDGNGLPGGAKPAIDEPLGGANAVEAPKRRGRPPKGS